LILLEGKAAKRTLKGGWAQNPKSSKQIDEVYMHEPGFPDLRENATPLKNGATVFDDVATYSGKIVNRKLEEGERIFRVFGPEGHTHGVFVKKSYASGRPGGNSFWGLNDVPKNASDWRHGSAVLDEWNRDGFIVVGTVMKGHSIPACSGLIAEQTGKSIGVQYLKGGAKQAMIKLDVDVAKELSAAAEKALQSGREVIEAGGVRWEIQATGWKDVNGEHGYPHHLAGQVAAQTVRLGDNTVTRKTDKE
jgi:hypothetical protein